MKICDLFENQWTNDQVTISHLYKKQQSAVHIFQIEYNKVMKSNPNDRELLWSTEQLLSPSLALRESGPIKSFYNTLPAFDKYPELKDKWTKLISAKIKYEEAGGNYELW